MAGLFGLMTLAGWGGCVAEVGPERPLRMPTVLPADQASSAKVVAVRDVLASGRESAKREDVGAMMSAVNTLPAAERGAAIKELFTAWVQEDLAGAGRLVQVMPSGPLQAQATEIVAWTKLDRDPTEALQWALAWPAPATEFVARQAVADYWVERDARTALERLWSLPATAARSEMLGSAVAGWARREARAAVGWVRELPEGDDKIRVTTSLGFALAQIDPKRAIEVAEWLPAGRDRWLVVGAIGQTWVARNAGDAWQWASTLPAGEAREAALSGIETGLGGARSRSRTNRVAVGAAVVGPRVGGGGGGVGETNAMVLGAERDRRLRREFEAALLESPVRAASWLMAQPLPDRRDEMMEELARRWLAINPEAARAWMEANIVSRDRREQLLREAGR